MLVRPVTPVFVTKFLRFGAGRSLVLALTLFWFRLHYCLLIHTRPRPL